MGKVTVVPITSSAVDIPDIWPVNRGGTGVTSYTDLKSALGIPSSTTIRNLMYDFNWQYSDNNRYIYTFSREPADLLILTDHWTDNNRQTWIVPWGVFPWKRMRSYIPSGYSEGNFLISNPYNNTEQGISIRLLTSDTNQITFYKPERYGANQCYAQLIYFS